MKIVSNLLSVKASVPTVALVCIAISFRVLAHRESVLREQIRARQIEMWRELDESTRRSEIELRKRQREDLRQAMGGVRESILKDSTLDITTLLHDLAYHCSPIGSKANVQVEGFTGFNVSITLERSPTTTDLASVCQCLCDARTPYIKSLRFIHHDTVVADLDQATVNEIIAGPPLTTAAITVLLEKHLGNTGDKTQEVDAASRGLISQDYNAHSVQAYRDAIHLINDKINAHLNAVNESLKTVTSVVDMGDVHSREELGTRMNRLKLVQDNLAVERAFFETPDPELRAVLAEFPVSPVLRKVLLQIQHRQFVAALPGTAIAFDSMDALIKTADGYLKAMELGWGSWHSSPNDSFIRFDEAGSRLNHEKWNDAIVAKNGKVEASLRAWSQSLSVK